MLQITEFIEETMTQRFEMCRSEFDKVCGRAQFIVFRMTVHRQLVIRDDPAVSVQDGPETKDDPPFPQLDIAVVKVVVEPQQPFNIRAATDDKEPLGTKISPAKFFSEGQRFAHPVDYFVLDLPVIVRYIEDHQERLEKYSSMTRAR